MRKYLFLLASCAALQATSASAADMPVKAPDAPYAPYASYSWTGFYAGAEFGGGWATQQITHTTGGTAFPAGTVDGSFNQTGALGGLYGGYNYQINQFVLGIDGDYTWADLNGSETNVSTVNGAIGHDNSNVKWIATATGRLGVVASNSWLLFVKGGGAWAGWSGSSTLNNAAGTVLVNTGSASSTRNGWTVGGGVEYALNVHASFKLEYDYIGFSTTSFQDTIVTAATGAVTSESRSATASMSMVKAGLAYKF
jgi:outer membrane immunogenic protein